MSVNAAIRTTWQRVQAQVKLTGGSTFIISRRMHLMRKAVAVFVMVAQQAAQPFYATTAMDTAKLTPGCHPPINPAG